MGAPNPGRPAAPQTGPNPQQGATTSNPAAEGAAVRSDPAPTAQNGAPRDGDPAASENGTPTPAPGSPTASTPAQEPTDAPAAEPAAPSADGGEEAQQASGAPAQESETSDSETTVEAALPSGPPAASDARTVELDRGDGSGSANAWFDPWADDPTQALPVMPATAAVHDDGPTDDHPTRPESGPATAIQAPISQAMASADPVTERLPLPPPTAQEDQLPPDGPPPTDVRDGDPERPPRRGARKVVLAVGGLVVLAGLAYGGDLLLGQGSVPRGVTVAGVAVGGLDLAAAEQRLHTEIDPRTTRPVQVRLGEATSTIDPGAAGLAVDWPATLAAVGEQPLNPITRLTSLFGTREVGVVTAADDVKLDAALTELAPIVNRPANEGTVKFTGVTPTAVDPEPGQELDVATAAGDRAPRLGVGQRGAAPARRHPAADHRRRGRQGRRCRWRGRRSRHPSR